MRAMDAPEVVDEDVEDAEDDNKERASPLCLESNSNHRARSQTNKRDKYTGNTPLPTEREANEQEDETSYEAEGDGLCQCMVRNLLRRLGPWSRWWWRLFIGTGGRRFPN